MKKLLLLLVIAFCVINLSAQTKKGTFYLGGSSAFNASFKSISYGEDANNDIDITQISIIPSVGWFIAKDFLLGVEFMYINDKTEKGNNYESKTTTLGIMPTLRYYIPSKNNLRLFLQAGYGWHKLKGEYSNDTDGILLGFGGGFAYFIKDNISFDLGVDYLKAKRDNISGYGYDNSDLTESTVNIRLGISVYFN